MPLDLGTKIKYLKYEIMNLDEEQKTRILFIILEQTPYTSISVSKIWKIINLIKNSPQIKIERVNNESRKNPL